MRFLKTLTSKKGQLSMEIGILVAAAVLVATVAAYYYVSNASKAVAKAGEQASAAVQTMTEKASSYVTSISNAV